MLIFYDKFQSRPERTYGIINMGMNEKDFL